MGWTSSRRGNGDRQALAAELLASLFGGFRGGAGAGGSGSGGGGGNKGGEGGGKPGNRGKRGPQWTCGHCKLPNDASRCVCRSCKRACPQEPRGAGKAEKASTAPQAVVPVAPRPWPRPPTPEERADVASSKAAALETAAAHLRAGGLEDEATAHEKSAAALRKEAAPESAGGRLDACAGFVARAEKRVEGAKAAVQTAETALAEARATQERLEDELAEGRRRLGELRAELAAVPAAQHTAPPDTSLLGDVHTLLTLMEGGACQFGTGSEPVLVAMQRLHAAIGGAVPVPAPELGAPLEPPAPWELFAPVEAAP